MSFGLTMGALALTRENALVFIVVLLVWSLARDPRTTTNDKRPTTNDQGPTTNDQRLLRPGLFLAGLALVLVPVAARNSYVGGGLFITTAQFGPNFYIGNHPGADGTYASLRYGRGAPEYEREDATELAERALGRRLTAAEVSGYWTDRALDFITSQPGAWLKLVARKFALLWNATEMVDTEDQATHAEWSWPLRILGPIGHFGVLVPLAVVGMIAAWRDRACLLVLYAMLTAYAASVLVFYVFARYRYPLVPFLILFAAAGIVAVARRVIEPGPKGPGLPVVALVVVVMAIFANWRIVPSDWMRAVTENNIGVALQAVGRYDESVDHYRRAIARRPDYAPALNNMATALRAAGRLDEALATYDRALALRADYPEAHFNLANALTEAGRPRDAIEHFRRALESQPGSADVHNNLGIALAGQGKSDEAIAEFRAALAVDPSSTQAHRNLGDALMSRGATAEGLNHLRQAVRLAPADASLRYDVGTALLEAGQTNEAIVELREAVTLSPRSADARNNLGIALGSAGRLDEAIEQFREALKIDPASKDARSNLEMALTRKR